MGDKSSANERGIGSVKAAINRYGGKVSQSTVLRNKSQRNASNSEETSSKAPELHIAKKRFDKINETRIITETVAFQAELELMKTKKIARELASQIEELKLKVSDQRAEKPTVIENHQHMKAVKELEAIKREVIKVKFDIERALEEKSRAEREADIASLRLGSYIKTAENLRKEIEDANEEEVLVELAQIQARKELEAIEFQKKEEKANFLSTIRDARKKINVLREEIEQAKKIEEVLELTDAEAVVLQNELNMIKEMDERISSDRNSKVQSVIENLEVARKEHATIKAEVFQFMTNMDSIRVELNNILGEKDQIQKSELKTERYINRLNSKLLGAKDKLETARASEEKAKMMLPSFTLSLQEMENVKESAQKEQKSITEEIARIKDDIQETESTTDVTEDRLWNVIQELEKIRNMEENALKKLETLIEIAVISRASKITDTITVSKFEYDYLTGCARVANKIADKKMEAANAWVEAVRANEEEAKIRTDMTRKEIEELKLKEERVLNELETSLKSGGTVENRSVRGRKSMAENSYCWTPVRQVRARKSGGSLGRRPIISTFWTVNRKRKAMGKIGNYLDNRQTENQKTGSLEEGQ